MNEDKKELMLDLLCKQAVYGLNEQETRQLEQFEYATADGESIDLTVAALGLIDLNTRQEMPAHLQSKILANAENLFGMRKVTETVVEPPVRQIILNETSATKPWFGWLGWAAAAAACVALAVSIFTPRNQNQYAGVPTPSPTQEERLDPAQQRQKLVDAPGQLLMAKLGKGTVKEISDVVGDIVWSDEKQAGYVRVKGLPKNDVSKETYQLWIFESPDVKYPVDGGTFDINADGEVTIPIDAKLKVKNPQMFAVTIEKAGGVVVSERGKIAALAKRET
jgi:Anti-sigma-K factor rskA